MSNNNTNGNSASDIITYIGVPLAVLGVLPILYNSVVTLLNASKIKRTLRHSRLTALTRSDIVNRIIEIELPRYAVTPLDRFQQPQEYWTLSRNPSSIPGGSWTTFNWKTNAVGSKTQRVEYADQLRQPQVDIAFGELVCYLLDLGAIPDAHGWKLLRSTGLWTPVGCALMKSPDGHNTALALAPLDDSDGNLSLSVLWKPEWTTRSYSDLPPYWVSLPAPPSATKKTEDDSTNTAAGTTVTSASSTVAPSTVAVDSSTASVPSTSYGDEDTQTDSAPFKPPEPPYKDTEHTGSTDSISQSTAAQEPAAITCQISADGIVTALIRGNTTNTKRAANLNSLYIEHIKLRLGRTDGMWFASIVTAYGTSSQTVLWNYRIPDEILTFGRRDTVPCGVLVLLGVVDDKDTPEWGSKKTNDRDAALDQHIRQFNERRAAEVAEQRLPPQQREQARKDRMQRENMQRMNDMRDRLRLERERREQREIEALQSPKWDTERVADYNLKWLQQHNHIGASMKTKEAAGVMLHQMVTDREFSDRLCRMLDRWKAWSDLGGMKKADFDGLRADQVAFAQATVMMGLITESSNALDGTLAMDLQECLNMWRKVRLG